ncbi:MAG: hypothetical protein HY960_00475 [Ignavibacteriae bacterium]|nr:hypothetical protein [Ignavibacteriota bacterium]
MITKNIPRQMISVKNRAKVLGIIITSCPSCGNPINFDRQGSKVCAYCEELVHIDLDKVEVMLHGPVLENKKLKISVN